MRTGFIARIALGAAAVLCCAAFTGCGEKKEEKLSRHRLKTEIASSNSSAKSIYTGVQSVITDLNAEDADLSWAKGQEFHYTGRDFQFDGPPNAGASAEDKFRYRVYVYYTDITDMDNVSIAFDDSWNVKCVAVKRTEKKYDTEIYGTHPHQLTVDDFDSIHSINDALKYAETTK